MNEKPDDALDSLRHIIDEEFIIRKTASNWTLGFVTRSPCASSCYNLEGFISFQLDHCSWGWKMRNSTLTKVLTDLDRISEKLLKFVRSKFRIISKYSCSTNICSCRNYGLTCITACINCKGNNCNNISLALQEEDKWEDDANLFQRPFTLFCLQILVVGLGTFQYSLRL